MSTTPSRLTASDFQPEVLQLFDRYVHGGISRREFLDRTGRVAGGATAAAGILAALTPGFVAAQVIKPDDARIVARQQAFDSPQGNGQVKGLLVKPADARTSANAAGAPMKLPVVLVIHENRGLNPHIEDIARRLAVDGFIAYAPDALAVSGGYPGDEDKAREAFAKLDQNKAKADFLAAARALQALPEGNGKVGAIGFCYGGGMVSWLATQMPELAAGVSFYGGQPPAADVAAIKAPLLIQYASDDERINAGWPAYEAALKAGGKRYEAHIYPKTQHGFNNDTTPRYDAAAAKLAWDRSVVFLKNNLG